MENPIAYLMTPAGEPVQGTAVVSLYGMWMPQATVRDDRGSYVREDAYAMKDSDWVEDPWRPVDGIPSWFAEVLRRDGWPEPYFREEQK